MTTLLLEIEAQRQEREKRAEAMDRIAKRGSIKRYKRRSPIKQAIKSLRRRMRNVRR